MKSLTTLVLLLLSSSIFANFQGDSLNYLTPQDSVFLTVDENQQKIIEHQLEYKQTMYSLAKFYGLELTELMYFNEDLGEVSDISVGSIIRIPIPNRAIKRYQKEGFEVNKHAPIYYRVQKGDNLFHISQRLFKMPIADVQKRNNIKGNNISPGQLLLMGWMSSTQWSSVPSSKRYQKRT